MTFVFTEKHVLTHYVSYSSKICVSTFSKTNVSDSGPRRRTHTHMGVALCLFLEPIHTRNDFVMMLREPTHTCVPLGIISTFGAPPDHYYRDLGILHSRCDQLSLALAESRWGGRSPVIASPRVAPPSDALCHPRPDSSSLQGPCLSPWLGPSPQDRHRPSDASSDLALAVAFQEAQSRTIRSWRLILRQ